MLPIQRDLNWLFKISDHILFNDFLIHIVQFEVYVAKLFVVIIIICQIRRSVCTRISQVYAVGIFNRIHQFGNLGSKVDTKLF